MGVAKSKGGMGFRDLIIFNIAPLAAPSKYGLFGCTIKAKFYPHSSVLEVTIGKQPSFAWRSIISAQEVI